MGYRYECKRCGHRFICCGCNPRTTCPECHEFEALREGHFPDDDYGVSERGND